MRTDGSARWYGYASLIGLSLFTITAALIHILRPDLEPLQATLSTYAVGPNGWILTIGLYALALALLLLAVGLSKALSESVRPVTGLIGLYLIAVAVLVVALFPTDLAGESRTLTGSLHNLGAYVVFYSFPIASALLSHSFLGDPHWRPIYRPAWLLFLAYATVLVITLMLFEGFKAIGYFGAFQRILILLILAWLFLAAGRLSTSRR